MQISTMTKTMMQMTMQDDNHHADEDRAYHHHDAVESHRNVCKNMCMHKVGALLRSLKSYNEGFRFRVEDATSDSC